jgi:hypothetical protein
MHVDWSSEEKKKNKYSLRPTNTAGLALKFYPTKTVHLDCSKKFISLKQYQILKDNCMEKCMEPIKCLSRCNFSYSNALYLLRI